LKKISRKQNLSRTAVVLQALLWASGIFRLMQQRSEMLARCYVISTVVHDATNDSKMTFQVQKRSPASKWTLRVHERQLLLQSTIGLWTTHNTHKNTKRTQVDKNFTMVVSERCADLLQVLRICSMHFLCKAIAHSEIKTPPCRNQQLKHQGS